MAHVTDFRISCALFAHPKFQKLLRRHGDHAGLSLLRLFGYTAQNKPDGNLAGLTTEDLEIAAGWTGEQGALGRALVEIGFVDGDEGTFALHDWNDHQPWVAGSQARSDAATRAALKKYGRSDEEIAKLLKRKGKQRCGGQANGKRRASATDAAPANPQRPDSISASGTLFPASQGTDGPVAEQPSLREQLFRDGRQLLGKAGMSSDSAGAFLAKLCKDYRDDSAVLLAIGEAAAAQPVEPKSWLIATLDRAKRTRPSNTRHGNGVRIGEQKHSESWQ